LVVVGRVVERGVAMGWIGIEMEIDFGQGTVVVGLVEAGVVV